MRLTNYTDYTFRVLIYLSAQKKDRLVQIKEIADTYQISKNHLMKVIYDLGKTGWVETMRGRKGGIRLSAEPSTITLGDVLRKTEEDFFMVECFDEQKNACLISPACGLNSILNEALFAYFRVLDQYTIADVVENRTELSKLLNS